MNIKPGYLGALLLLISGSSWASCSFTQGGVGPGPFTIPALVVSQDATPGTILYSQELVGSAIKLKCTGVAPIYKGYRYLSTRWENSVGLSAVYKTNVPGIGIQAKWNNTGRSLATDGNYILSYFEAEDMTEDYEYTISPRIGIRIVVIGPIESGTIDASRLLAEWVYDNQTVAQLTFNPVSVNVQANTCNLVEKNISVPLKQITTGEFNNGYSDVVSDDAFKIQLDACKADIQVDYRFTTSGSTGVTSGNILSIASGTDAAEGVGIQILDNNNNVLQFDTDYTAASKTTENQAITIPLQARYVKTGTVKAGQVDAVATFEVYYR
ncbi:fimbrial protein [Citrobacter cronae]|uniref:fimbrial protein n=1 Tax=Citrobacter TaxID=544 RepID=UPI001C12216D|nr:MULTISPECIES: fimbrial protein [Citrobacter]MBU5604724.1 fimbrial protein [Citrobacter sp. S55_ASV_140]MEB5756730.1 fimbrial protein [Citrobacter cronae]